MACMSSCPATFKVSDSETERTGADHRCVGSSEQSRPKTLGYSPSYIVNWQFDSDDGLGHSDIMNLH